jgi:kumamolisin
MGRSTAGRVEVAVMRRRLTVVAAAAAIAAASVVPGVAAAGSATTAPSTGVVRTLLGTVPALVNRAVDLGAVNPLKRLDVILPLALPDQSGLDRLVDAEYTPGSPQYHRFIDPATFGRQFGAPAGRVNAVVATLQRLGLRVTSPSINRLYVKASGTVALLESLFGTTINNFRLSNGRTFFANVRNISLPASLVGRVTSVIGLDDVARPYPAVAAASRTPATLPTVGPVGEHGGATPCPAAIAGAGYTAPQLATAYNFNGLYAKGLLGQRMTAALVEFDDFHHSNVAAVESCYGLHTRVARHVVDGGTGGPPSGGELEDMADITTMLEMLPKLKRLDVYVAPITGLGEIELYNRFATDHRDPVLSSSWGNCEQLNSAADNRLFGLITEEAAAQGQQIFQAAGDSGAVDCRGFPPPTLGSISVEQEAAVPWVTGVGGTDLGQRTANGLGGPRDEATWNDLGAGGGGVSTLWTMPAWQRALKSARTAPGRSGHACGAARGQLCREVPDISANASSGLGLQGTKFQFPTDVGSAGYSIYCGTANCSLLTALGVPLPPLPPGPGGVGNWLPIGGTSLSAPLVASAAVLWDQQARRAHLTGYGLLNPSLYRDAASPKRYARDFHDITTDSNSDQFDPIDCPTGCNPAHLYRARKGYDMATGLGSINAAALGQDLVRQARRIALNNDTVRVYGYRHGVPTTAPVVASTGLRHASFTARSSARWLHVRRTGTAPGPLRWWASPKGLLNGTRHGRIVVVSNGHRATLRVSYTVTRRARVHLSATRLRFAEPAIDSSGKPTAAVCGATLWNDELFDPVNGSTGTKVARSSKRVLRISNTGPKGSVLHWQAFAYSFTGAWLGTDLTRGRQADAPGRALSPSDGVAAAGHQNALHLVSTANANALGGFPTMNQGTYHGVVVIHDLADPRRVYRVPSTLVLGNGRKTPHVHARAPRRVTVAKGRATTATVRLSDASHGCGYVYSLSSRAGWARPSGTSYSGVVGPTGAAVVPIRISARQLSLGTHRLSLVVQSQNAEPNPTHITIRVRVT